MDWVFEFFVVEAAYAVFLFAGTTVIVAVLAIKDGYFDD